MRLNHRLVRSSDEVLVTNLNMATYVACHVAPLRAFRDREGAPVIAFPPSAREYINDWRRALDTLRAELAAAHDPEDHRYDVRPR